MPAAAAEIRNLSDPTALPEVPEGGYGAGLVVVGEVEGLSSAAPNKARRGSGTARSRHFSVPEGAFPGTASPTRPGVSPHHIPVIRA